MKGDKMADTKTDPYQDPAYHAPQPIVETMTAEQSHIAPEKEAGRKAEEENVKAENNRDKGALLNR